MNTVIEQTKDREDNFIIIISQPMNILSPLTNSQNIKLVKTIDTEKIINQWQKKFKIDITEELHGYKEICLYECNQTKLKFFVPFDVAGSNNLYEKLQKNDWYYMPHKWEHDIAIQDLKGCQKVLEIGCGRGDFVRRLCQDLKLFAQGIELNTTAAAYAQTKNIPVSNINLYELINEQKSYFDAICTFQVLEHISEPKKFIEAMIKLLRPGGKLIMAVPNSESFPKYSDSVLLDQPPHHMTKWSLKTFKSLESIFDLKLQRIKFEPLAEYHIDWYFLIQKNRLPRLKLLRRLFDILINENIKPIVKNKSFARRLIKGHTLYVCFEKK